MAATSWSYRVPYCDSIQHAFNSLRWEIFQSRQYRGDKAARSIYALRRAQGEEGTHSILDMQWVAAEPGYETVAPLSPAQLLATFGTMRPGRDALEGVVLPQRPPWEGTYIVLYHRDQPREILFYGSSGSGAAARDVADPLELAAERAQARLARRTPSAASGSGPRSSTVEDEDEDLAPPLPRAVARG